MSKKRDTVAANPATGATAAGPNYKIQRRVDAIVRPPAGEPEDLGAQKQTVIAWIDGNPTYGSKVKADKALDAMEMSGVFRVARLHMPFLINVEQRNVVISRKPAE